MTRSIAVRLIALLGVVVASFWYIAFDVVGWRIGAQDYSVTVMMQRAGGVYTEATVSYRGVPVGRVTRLALRPDGVAVVARINPNIKIPADSRAQVRELSAAGEQYLDLVPVKGGGPYLHGGSVIPASRTTTPVPISQVLKDTSSLLNSVNTKNLNTVTNSLASGLGGTGANLRNIVVAGQRLFAALQAAAPATVQLITAGHTVLRGAVATDAAFGRFASGLDKLTAQLRRSNPDINALLGNSSYVAHQGTLLLNRYAGSFSSILRDAGTVSKVTLADQPAVQALFQVLPVFAGRIGAVVHGGTLHVELYFNTNNPVCPYIPGSATALPTQRTGAPDLSRTCPLSSTGTLGRGAPGP